MFCPKCGKESNNDDDKFCWNCGTSYQQMSEVAVTNQANSVPLDNSIPPELQGYKWIKPELYKGVAREFPLIGSVVNVSGELDAYMYYRKVFKNNAYIQYQYMRRDYYLYIHNIYQYMDIYPQMFGRYIAPLIDDACEILVANGIYDVTREEFYDTHIKDFKATYNDLKVMEDSINLTLEANQRNIVNSYNNIPNIGFIGGLFTVAAVEAGNIAIRKSYESKLNNLNLTPAQDYELFCRINPEACLYNSYADFWSVYLSLCFRLHKAGKGVWYHQAGASQKAKALWSNYDRGLIPNDDIPSVMTQIILLDPKFPDIFGELKKYYIRDYTYDEIMDVCRFFGFE